MREYSPGEVTVKKWSGSLEKGTVGTILVRQGNMEHICVCNKMVTQYPFLLHSIVKAFLILLVFLCLLKNGGWWKIGRLTWTTWDSQSKTKKPSKMPKHSPGEVTILLWHGNMEHICVCNKMVSQYPLSSTALWRLFSSSLASFVS